MAQERYWKEMYQMKVHINYVEALLCKTEKCDRAIKIFMAVASSASIGAWVVWKELSILWATIIAFSQVIAAIDPHLPYKERINNYSAVLHELEEVFIQAESKWHEIFSGRLSEGDINKARKNVRLQKHKILKKHLPSSVFPVDEAKANRAEELAFDYFTKFYPT